MVYDPKTLIPHAALRRQGFPHCERFLVAAIRRCMGRVSVPFLGIALSRPLLVIGLVGFYPTNYLIRRRLLLRRVVTPFLPRLPSELIQDYPHFREAILNHRADSHALLSRLPLFHPRRGLFARLACLKHAASVHPELGSNSQKNSSFLPHKVCQIFKVLVLGSILS